jgi:HAD superfamily phosphoserine phosphatase-like hydrolase
MRRKTDTKWSKAYGEILGQIELQYGIARGTLIANIKASKADVNQWFSGSRFPNISAHENICNVIKTEMSNKSDPDKNTLMINYIDANFNHLNHGVPHPSSKKEIGNYLAKLLITFYFKGKTPQQTIPPNSVEIYTSTGKTQAVVFDFDGTLTMGNTIRTTWESIWTALGYDVQECRDLHARFNKNEFSHAKWCKLTEDKFIKRKLDITTVLEIAKEIQLITGFKETIEELKRRKISIFIVSGSILTIIKEVLKDIYDDFKDVRANKFEFSPDGLLTEILGTEFDFKGKAEYIKKIAVDLKISTKDILFVGNDRNDKWVYEAGAETLCINPRYTDVSDPKVWNNSIEECKDLRQIFRFIKPVSKII